LACRKCFCYAESLKAHIEEVHSSIQSGECQLKFKKDDMLVIQVNQESSSLLLTLKKFMMENQNAM
jgi:hypothetical protein